MAQFLTVSGFVNGAGQALLLPGYLVDVGDDPKQVNLQDPNITPITVTQSDENGKPLAQHQIPAAAILDSTDETVLFLAGRVPFQASTRLIQLQLQGNVIHEQKVAANSPAVKITWTPPKDATGTQTITWDGSHPDSLPLEYTVLYSYDGGLTFRPISLSSKTPHLEVDFDQLPGGKGVIMVAGTDGVNTTRVQSSMFAVPTKQCLAMILQPSDGSTIASGTRVLLQGQGYYREERQPELQALTWSSSIDGTLGEGSAVETNLSKGTHTITLTAGTASRQDTTRITLAVTE
jgi:hypothetical protein